MRPILNGPGLALALVQLPADMRRALRTFRKITGLTAVTSLAASPPESGKPLALSPPVHPRCVKQLRSVRAAPCRKQWLIHMRSGRRSADAISHICPIGLRCTCVPVRFDNRLVGVAKLVVDSETSDAAFSAATDVLKLVVSRTPERSLVSALSEEVGALRGRVEELHRVHLKDEPPALGAEEPAAAHSQDKARNENGTVVERALAYLKQHYQEPNLSLQVIGKAVGCNPKYLSTRFTQTLGKHLHSHLIALRVSHACRLLMNTDHRIKEIAFASGFSGAGRLAGAFQRQFGVSPGEYRRIFSRL